MKLFSSRNRHWANFWFPLGGRDGHCNADDESGGQKSAPGVDAQHAVDKATARRKATEAKEERLTAKHKSAIAMLAKPATRQAFCDKRIAPRALLSNVEIMLNELLSLIAVIF
jgi:hypothetical protein